MTPSTDKNLMNRRQFLQTGTAVAALSTSAIFPDNVEAQSQGARDKLNPPGIRTAGIRMIPVVGGKYKVWTKRKGSHLCMWDDQADYFRALLSYLKSL